MQGIIDSLIRDYGDSDQRSDAWHDRSSNMLTASEIFKAKASATASSRRELIMSKLLPRSGGSGGVASLDWGTQFEEVAKELVEQSGISVRDLACVIHPEYPFLGASPDGLLLGTEPRHGRLIEIKCPISREVDPGAPIPDSYYDQVQLQLVCTGLQECEYVEFKFVKHSYAEWMAATQIKSCFAVSTVNRKVVYKKIADTRTLQEWMMSFMEDRLDWDLVYWSLKSRKDLLIQKDAEWFTEHFPSFQSVWNEIVEYRKSGTFPPPIKSTVILDLDAM
jgi:putative phage-type endonuclease